MEIILASNSPRRRELLKTIADFKVVVSNAKEETDFTIPQEVCVDLAFKKAEVVAKEHYNSIVIGADTIVVCNGQIIGKPKDIQDNIKILKMLSGTSHFVYTGYAILYKDYKKLGLECTQVVFKKLTEQQILNYANSGSGLDKAGGYGIQDDVFVEKIVGSYDNVVGFPTEKIKIELDYIKEVLK